MDLEGWLYDANKMSIFLDDFGSRGPMVPRFPAHHHR